MCSALPSCAGLAGALLLQALAGGSLLPVASAQSANETSAPPSTALPTLTSTGGGAWTSSPALPIGPVGPAPGASGAALLGSKAYRVDPAEALFQDRRVRMPDSCAAAHPAAVAVVPEGTEIHSGPGAKWEWVPDPVSCDDQCVPTGASYACQSSGSKDYPKLRCGCEQCPCELGRGGFACEQCTNDTACPEGTTCSTSTIVTQQQEKAFTCTFPESMYSAFFGDGYAHPLIIVEWAPSDGNLQISVMQSMCSTTQPVMLQCSCSECVGYVDTVDGLRDVIGECATNEVPSPCGSCGKCTCQVTDDGPLADSPLRPALEGYTGGAIFGCQTDGACIALLVDVSIPLAVMCSSGLCAADHETGETKSVGFVLGRVAAAFIGIMFWMLGAAAVVLISFLNRSRDRRLARSAETCPPGLAVEGNRSLTLSWQEVRCVRGGRAVLNNVSGVLQTKPGAGKLVALTGPSGCGKTTLLDYLSGRGQRQDGGMARLNGVSLSRESMRRHVGYVPQREVLGPTLTVRENLNFSAALRLPRMSAAQRAGRVRWVMQRLNIEAIADSKVGDTDVRGVSGGERRRVQIATELLVAPAVIFLDEPATGLDASGALELGQLLAALASEGRLLVCTLHQPRRELIELFDETIVLEHGTVAAHHKSAKAASNSSPPSAVKPSGVSSAPAPWNAHAQMEAGRGSHPQRVSKPRQVAPPAAHKPPQTASNWSPPRAEERDTNRSAHSTGLTTIETTAWIFQLLALWNRSLLEASRGSRQTLWSTLVIAGVGLMVGSVFYQLDNGIAGVQGRFGSIFFIQLFFAFCGLEVCTLWFWDRSRLAHERNANFYSSTAYFVAKASAYIWWSCLVAPGLFVAVAYPMVGYSEGNIGKPMFFYICVCCTAVASSGLCLILSSFMGSLGAGVSTSSIVLTVLLMYSGFLRPADAIHPLLRWVVYLSPYSHGFQAMISSELRGVDTKIDAEGYDTVGIRGDIWLVQFDIDPSGSNQYAAALGVIAVAMWILAFIPVKFELYNGMRCLPQRKVAAAEPVVKAHSRRESVDQDDAVFSHTFSWDRLTVKLPNGKPVFENFRGTAVSKRALAVLGRSGCGKTTLLTRLYGECQPGRTSGEVALDGVPIELRQLSRLVGFVHQYDALHQSLTVHEVLAFSAALRLNASPEERERRIRRVLRGLKIEHIANSRLGGERKRGVSGGERRRAAVGVELVASKRVLILDEPTSGLDSAAALALCSLLAQLSEDGRVVMACIHQPPPEVLDCFADVLVLAPGGRIAYHGPRQQLEDYVSRVASNLDARVCAADRILDAISDGDRRFVEAYPHTEVCKAMHAEIEGLRGSERRDEVAMLIARPPTFASQMVQLLRREVLICMREPGLAPWHFASALLAGALLGFTYWQLEANLVGVISRIGLFFALQCILGMQALQSLMAWREGHTGFVRERAAGFYGAGAYVLAKAAVDVVVLRIGPPLLFGAVLYKLAGLQEGRELLCLVTLCLASVCSSMFCFALGALTPRSPVGLPIAVLLLLVFLLFGGALVRDAPVWMTAISYFQYSYQLLVANEFQGLDFVFDPEGVAGDFGTISGEEWLDLLNFKQSRGPGEVFILMGFAVGYVCLAWLALARRA